MLCKLKVLGLLARNVPIVLATNTLASQHGLRISVAHVVNLVATGMTPAQIVSELPDLEEEDIRQALGYAAVIAEDELHPIPAGKYSGSSPTRGSRPIRSISGTGRPSGGAEPRWRPSPATGC
jgi:uncharacterized protein DUF433